MKRMVLFVVAVSACAHMASASQQDQLSGRWHGVLMKGALSNLVQFEFSRDGNGWRGNYWGPAPVGDPVRLKEISINPHVHFQVGTLGVFEGVQHGDVIEGSFTDSLGSGTFRMEKLPEFDDRSVG